MLPSNQEACCYQIRLLHSDLPITYLAILWSAPPNILGQRSKVLTSITSSSTDNFKQVDADEGIDIFAPLGVTLSKSVSHEEKEVVILTLKHSKGVPLGYESEVCFRLK